MATSKKVYDTTEEKYSEVVQIVGTPYDDYIHGIILIKILMVIWACNGMLRGGNGKDT